MSRLHKVDSAEIQSTKEFSILSRDVNHLPTSIKRLRDDTVWSIDDFVTNGTKMKGYIKEFEFYLSEETSSLTCYVSHTWSGVGMALENLQPATPNTPEFYNKQVVSFRLNGTSHNATVRAVHQHENKVRYDLDIWLEESGGNQSTRIHNVDSDLISVK
jgi:sRNA-binding regulator protein Hfq